jgi:acyl-homoserine lactone acylase PvdQ
MDAIVEHHGSLDATYGDHHRVGRGDQSWPVGGAGHGPGTSTLRAVGYDREERDGHTMWGARGQTSTQVVVMSDPPRSWIYLPQGQSDREDSPHFDDQAERLFSRRQMKPSWWLPEDLAGHVESRTVLERKATP